MDDNHNRDGGANDLSEMKWDRMMNMANSEHFSQSPSEKYDKMEENLCGIRVRIPDRRNHKSPRFSLSNIIIEVNIIRRNGIFITQTH